MEDHILQELNNSDAASVGKGEWDKVRSIAKHLDRDWEAIFRGFDTYKPMKCPIILYVQGTYYLLSGRIRLCVARACGIIPEVVVMEIKR